MKIFSLNGNIVLAERIADSLGTKLGLCKINRFSDGEISISIEESVRGDDVFIIQSTSSKVNEYYMELIIMIDALKRASAGTINVVLPYYGYASRDYKKEAHNPITAKLIANLIINAGATRVLTFDIHNVQVQSFFDKPLDNLVSEPLFASFYKKNDMLGEDYVVVAPKNSEIKRARNLADYLNTALVIVDKEENGYYLIGEVSNKNCIIFDDILRTGKTFSSVANLLKEQDALEIYACATHGLFTERAKELLDDSPISNICVTDSCYVNENMKPKKITYITCSSLIAEAMNRICFEQPLSPLFELSGIQNLNESV